MVKRTHPQPDKPRGRPRPGAVFVELSEPERQKLEMLAARYREMTKERGTLAGVIRRLIAEAK